METNENAKNEVNLTPEYLAKIAKEKQSAPFVRINEKQINEILGNSKD